MMNYTKKIHLIIICAAISLLFPNYLYSAGETAMDNSVFHTGENALDYWLDRVAESAETVHIAVYKLSSSSALNALIEAEKRGVEVKVIVDGEAAGKKSSLVSEAISAGLDITVWPTDRKGKLHTKYYIFDGKSAIIGSFNLSESAEKSNTESFYYTKNPALVEEMLRSWEELKKKALTAG